MSVKRIESDPVPVILTIKDLLHFVSSDTYKCETTFASL